MYSIDQLSNARHPVTLAGREFLVRPLVQTEWGELQAWLKSRVPSPIVVAIRGLAEASKESPIPQPIQDALFRQAQEETRRWPPRAASAEWFKALGGVDGGDAKFLYEALRISGNDIAEDEAAKVESSITRSQFWEIVNICVFGEQPVPKAEGEATPHPSSPTTGDGSTSTSASNAA